MRIDAAPSRRISLDLPIDVADRMAAQAAMLECSRAELIETACLGMLRVFEAIDAEEGCPCTCGSPNAHARWCTFRPRPS